MWQELIIQVATGLVAFIAFLYFLAKYKLGYWTRKGIPGPEPHLVFGNMKPAQSLQCTETENVNNISMSYPERKYIGIYHFWKPVLLVTDLEIIKRICVKDFEYFVDHNQIVGHTRNDQPLNSLFTMEGNIWKSRRQYFTKMFTPKRLKEYIEHVRKEPLGNLLVALEDKVKKDEDINMVELALPFALHSLTSSLFGVDLSGDSKRTAYLKRVIVEFLQPPAAVVMKFLGYSVLPGLLNFFRVATLPSWHFTTFSVFMNELISVKKGRDSVLRGDAVDLSVALLDEGSKDITRISYGEAMGHMYSFLQAGTNTNRVTLCHALHQLSKNRPVQERLRKEVDSILNGNITEISYEDVSKMPYLGAVITETLRLKPVIGVHKRLTTKDYKLDDNLTVPAGMIVYLDAYYVHMNPAVFKEPEEFRPERWLTGEADPGAALAFGIGPRICIGQRFAEVVLKVGLASIISKYIVLPSDRMVEPMRYDPQAIFINTIPRDGIWIRLQPRN